MYKSYFQNLLDEYQHKIQKIDYKYGDYLNKIDKISQNIKMIKRNSHVRQRDIIKQRRNLEKQQEILKKWQDHVQYFLNIKEDQLKKEQIKTESIPTVEENQKVVDDIIMRTIILYIVNNKDIDEKSWEKLKELMQNNPY